MPSVIPMFRYHITTSGCELAKKLVQANATDESADCMAEPKHVKTDTKRAGALKQNVPVMSEPQLPRYDLPAAAPTAARGVFSESADDGEDWRKELGVALPEQTGAQQSW